MSADHSAALLAAIVSSSEDAIISKDLMGYVTVDSFETLRRRKVGTLVEVSLAVSPVKDAQGTIVGAPKIARDITDRKRMERAAMRLLLPAAVVPMAVT